MSKYGKKWKLKYGIVASTFNVNFWSRTQPWHHNACAWMFVIFQLHIPIISTPLLTSPPPKKQTNKPTFFNVLHTSSKCEILSPSHPLNQIVLKPASLIPLKLLKDPILDYLSARAKKTVRVLMVLSLVLDDSAPSTIYIASFAVDFKVRRLRTLTFLSAYYGYLGFSTQFWDLWFGSVRFLKLHALW